MPYPVYVLGLSAFYHDSAAALLKNGEIIAAAQEERFTRKKNDFSFPSHAIKYCFDEAGIKSHDLSLVVFYDKPFRKFERILHTSLQYAPWGLVGFAKAIPVWIREKIWTKQEIGRKLDYKGEIIFTEHHQSHAASAFYPSPFKEAAFLTIDGVGEWATASYGVAKDSDIRILKEILFPHSLGLLYSAVTFYAGFKVNFGEYKLMGLAPYGDPKYKDLLLKEVIDIKDDGSIRLNMRYFNYCTGLTMVNHRFEKLIGFPRREPDTNLRQQDMDLARSVQEITEEVMLKMASHVKKETGMQNLCLAGGVALNCVGNGRILRAGIFDRIWIQPASGDAGGSLGAAFFGWYKYIGRRRQADGVNDFQMGSYLGPQFDQNYAESYFKNLKIAYSKLSDEEVTEIVSDLIADGKVVGWFQGRMEFGPRALGNRSILGDARSERMQEIMNLKIKFRESFRPFAPSVLEEKCPDYFELNTPSPYMLITAPVNEKIRTVSAKDNSQIKGLKQLKIKRSRLPAVTHVDYSARMQSVNKSTNPLFYNLIKKFYEKYGWGVIINTSFNVRGEPIVCTPEEAYNCFMHTNIDYLVIGNCLIEKEEKSSVGHRMSMAAAI